MLFGRPSSLEFPEIETVYDRFAALHSFSPELGGRLLLHALLDRDGVGLSMAANVAGIASLCMEPETFLAKQALRAGVCDFLVKDLDEALRILKNEIRKQRPVSVALTGEPEIVLAEVVERGLQPEIVHLHVEGSNLPGAETLIARGARPLPRRHYPADSIAVHWSVAREPLRWLPLADSRAAHVLDPRDRTTQWRKHWIESSPRYLGRPFAAQRFLRMTPAEADAFFAAVQRDVESGEIQVAVSVVRNGEEELVLS
jgi:hypothetical protein